MRCITADAHSASAKIRSELPGRGREAEKDAEKYAAQAGAKVDSAVSPRTPRLVLVHARHEHASPTVAPIAHGSM